MIKPPLNLEHFLVYREAYYPDYQIYSFPDAPDDILNGYIAGVPISEDYVNSIKSYIFDESLDELVNRNQLLKWLKESGILDAQKVCDACSSWRLIYVNRKFGYEIPNYQDHPIRTEAWDRLPVAIQRKSKEIDWFDPLQAIIAANLTD